MAAHAAVLYASLPRPGWRPGTQDKHPAAMRVSVLAPAEPPRSAAPAMSTPQGEPVAPPPPGRDDELDAAAEAAMSSWVVLFDGQAYVARPWLDVPPAALGAVFVPFPPVEGLVDLTVDVALFIDEAGVVRRVDVETPRVAEPFVRAVTQAFTEARFTPGEIGGVPVRSKIRVQVEFRA